LFVDSKVELTEKGRAQARRAGGQIFKLLEKDASVRFFVSPYRRSRETCQQIIQVMHDMGLDDDSYTLREDPRLREQDWGNLQDTDEIRMCRKARKKFGNFYYRFPRGESGADVYTRVDSFWSSIFREFRLDGVLDNFVIVSHGITIRMLLMRYFKWTVEEFELLWNPTNCQIITLG